MKLIHKNFNDIDDLCHSLKAWDVEMYPLASIRPGDLAGNVIQTSIGNCLYGYGSFSSPLKMFGAPPNGLITFNVMEVPQMDYWWRGHNLSSEMVWVFPIGSELHSIASPGFRVHTFSVTEERIAEVAAEYGIDLPPPSRYPEVFTAPSHVLNNIRLLLYCMKDYSVPVEQESVDKLLRMLVPLWLQPDVLGEQRRPINRTRDRAVIKSLEIIEECDISTLSLEFLIKESHVSKRTLQYGFQERFGTSPSALIKSMRLVATKAALRRAKFGEITVADIAMKFGFWHAAQFATDYQKSFGELPSETLRKTF